MHTVCFVVLKLPTAVLFRRTVHSKRIRKVSSAVFSVNNRLICSETYNIYVLVITYSVIEYAL